MIQVSTTTLSFCIVILNVRYIGGGTGGAVRKLLGSLNRLVLPATLPFYFVS